MLSQLKTLYVGLKVRHIYCSSDWKCAKKRDWRIKLEERNEEGCIVIALGNIAQGRLAIGPLFD